MHCSSVDIFANTIEGDNKSIVDAINDLNTPKPYADVIVVLKASILWSEVCHVQRSANGVAHVIAHSPEFISISMLYRTYFRASCSC